MCNFKHTNRESKVQEIPEAGFGWKIFEKIDGEFCGMSLFISYQKTENEIIWKEHVPGDGFCFFRSKAVANDCLKRWICAIDIPGRKYVIKKIAYFVGLQSHLEERITSRSSYRISLCKVFEIL